MTESVKILIVDDEERLRESLKKMLEIDGFSVETAEDGKAGLDALVDSSFDVAIIDLVMPKRDGMWLIGEINKRKIDVSTVVATGYGTVELVVKAMKQGAWDFIQKPVDYELMKVIVDKAAERRRFVRAQNEAEKRIKEQNEELKEVNEKLKELDKLKTDFLSMAVHEYWYNCSCGSDFYFHCNASTINRSAVSNINRCIVVIPPFCLSYSVA